MICTPHQMLLGFSNQGLDWQCMWHVIIMDLAEGFESMDCICLV